MCFGAAAAFCLTVGRGCDGGGVPRRSRALALTALVTEKDRFLGFDLLTQDCLVRYGSACWMRRQVQIAIPQFLVQRCSAA